MARFSFIAGGALALLAAAVPQDAATCPSVSSTNGAFIYVAPTGFDTPTCGIAEVSACLTLQQGVNRCAGTPNCTVVARHGIYSVGAPVTISKSMQLVGSCSFNGEKPNRYRTIVRGLPVFAIQANGGTVQITGFTMLANDAAPGAASIALTVDQSVLVLDKNVIVSGTGGSGKPGTNAANGAQANNGQSVQPGSTAGGLGGPGVACADPGHEISGHGGNGAQLQGVDSSGGLWHTTCTPVNNPKAGKGGNAGAAIGGNGGGNGGPGCDCIGGVSGNANTPDGTPGDPGAPGAASAVGGTASLNALGQFSGLNWTPGAAGGSGNWGLPGAGGGGGGAGGFASVEISLHHNDYEGQPGGGGGSGGCGGLGGGGGSPGGGSFPIVARASYLKSTASNVLVPGPGGTGGQGGKGGSGSAGGAGGRGVDGHQTSITGWYNTCQGTAPGSGGRGNSGGTGGAGSGGAGGNGGPSFAVVLLQPASQTLPEGSYYAAQPGLGGAAGDGGGGNGTAAKAQAGLAGAAGQSHTYAAAGSGCCAERPPKHHRPPKRHRRVQRNHGHGRQK